MAWFKRRVGAGPAAAQSVSNSTVLGTVTQTGPILGDAYFYGDSRHFGLEPFPPPAETLPVAKAQEAPSRLLRASQQTVPFSGREPELAELSAWCDEPGQCSVRLIYGPGGQGKTRLLAAFGEACVAGGWEVVQARLTPLAEGAAAMRGTAPGLLVVADHAERWPVDDLLALVQTMLRLRCTVRVLLAGRPAGRWWISVRAELDDMNVQAGAIDLAPLSQHVDRRELFTAARDSFAAALGVGDAAAIAPPAAIDQAAYESVLTVHMAALAAVSVHIDGGQAPADPTGISEYLLTREREQWRKLYERKAVLTPEPLMGQAVFTAILTRPVSDRLGTQALIRAGVVSAIETARQVLNDHRFCYPPADKATVLEPLHPDWLGEDFLALQMPGSGWKDYEPDPWAGDALGALLAFEPGTDPPPWTRAAVTVLAGAAERWPHLQHRLSDLILDEPRLATGAGGSALAAIAELPGIDIAALEVIERHFPEGGNLDQDIGIAGVAARLTAHRLEATDKPEEQAALMLPLAARLENAGDPQAALVAVSFAAGTYGELAEHDPDSYEPQLARSLIEVGKLSDDPGASFEATEQAVKILKRLVAKDVDRYEPYYARALNNLGNHHPDLSQALQAAQDSVATYQRLAQADPATYEPEYAGALGNLARRLSALDQNAEALTQADKAVEIFKRLVAADRAAHEPQLAVLLNNLGTMAGTPQESVAATSQAVEIFRRLAAANPPKYDPVLAISLDNLSLRYADLKQDADARAASGEAAEIWERLTEADMVRYEPRLAAQWLKFARLCVAQHAELPAAKRAVEQALTIYQRMPATQTGLVFTDFEQVQCWFVDADILDGLGRTEEAARIRKPLTDKGWQPS
jgi:tetratricopeptide (TPR) repeat protein